MNSYQKLKKANQELKDRILAILDSEETYLTERVKHELLKALATEAWRGASQPTGEIEGLWSKIIGEEEQKP